MEKKTVIYIGNFNLPNNDAASQLVISNGKILKELGYKVVFIGNDPEMSEDIKVKKTKNQINGFVFYTMPFSKSLKKMLNSYDLYSQLDEIFLQYEKDLKLIICYGSPVTPASLVFKISGWSKAHKINFVGNNADVSAMSHGKLIERFLKRTNYLLLRHILKTRTQGTIAVSEYIKKYYLLPGKSSVIIPPLVDFENTPELDELDSKKINLVYAGTPFPVDGRKVDVASYKDRLDIAIEMLYEVYKDKKGFHLNIYGISQEQYLNVVNDQRILLEKCKDMLTFYGKIPHDQIKKNISQADFTINLRDSNQMTNAGFSTKFVESISCGTPTITTNTSDLKKFMIEGKNGYFIDIENKKNGISKLVQILSVSKSEIQQMKSFSYHSHVFDYRNYVGEMKRFLTSLDNNKGDEQ